MDWPQIAAHVWGLTVLKSSQHKRTPMIHLHSLLTRNAPDAARDRCTPRPGPLDATWPSWNSRLAPYTVPGVCACLGGPLGSKGHLANEGGMMGLGMTIRKVFGRHGELVGKGLVVMS